VNVDKDGCLTIKMEHKDEKKDENKPGNKNGEGRSHYLRREFSYSNYEQALTLPEDIEKDKIEAKVNNGVLHITLPRTQKAEKETKRIEVA
jgi:HSP20 family protein